MKTSDSSMPGCTDLQQRMTRTDLWTGLALMAVASVVTGIYFDRGLDAFDAGLFAAEAERVANGGIYGKDFLAPYGPGRYYLIAILFSVFGYTLKVQACLWLVLRGVIGLLVYLTGRSLLPRALAVLPALAVIAAPGALHKSFFQAGALLIALSYLIYRRHRTLRACFGAGALAGVVALFRVDVGLFGAISFVLLLVVEKFWDRPSPDFGQALKRIVFFGAGALAVTLPVFFYFLAVSDLTVVFEAEWHRTLNVSRFADILHVPDLSDSFSSVGAIDLKPFLMACLLWFAHLTYLLLAITTFCRRLAGHERWGGIELFSLALFGVPVLNQVRITPTFNHLLHALPLVLIAWTVLVVSIGSIRPMNRLMRPAVRHLLTAVVVAVPLGLPVYYNLAFTRGVLPGSMKNRFEFTEPLTLARAGIYETPDTVREIERAVRYIESVTDPGDALFAGPFLPVLNFLTGRPPAVRFLEPFYYFNNEAMQKRMIEDLERTRPPVILLDPAVRVGGQALETDARLIYAYIRDHYTLLAPSKTFSGRYAVWIQR